MTQSTNVHSQLNSVLQRWVRFPLHISQRKLLLVGGDLCLLNASLLLGLHLSSNSPRLYTNIALQLFWCATLTLLWLLIASANDNYEIGKAARLPTSTFGIIKALLITGTVYTFLPIVSPPLLTDWVLLLLVGTLAFGSLFLWRILYATVLVQPNFRRRALILGSGQASRAIVKVIEDHNPGYEIVGYIADEVSEQQPEVKDVSVRGKWANLAVYVQNHDVSDIILANRRDLEAEQLQAILKCFEQGVRVVSMPELYEEITGHIPVELIGGRWLGSLPIDWDSRKLYLIVKRAMDIAIAGLGLLCLAPFFALVALAIKLDSRGPIFYRPERLGRGGKPFRLLKFRTMVANADRIGDPTFTAVNDNRITQVGRILRAIHMDELPQFINVLAGQMSVVGPRPERYVPEMEETIPYYRARLAVNPGATGWALVKQGYAEGLEGTSIKLQYDLYYIKHQSLYLDVLILFKTVIHMFTMRGR